MTLFAHRWKRGTALLAALVLLAAAAALPAQAQTDPLQEARIAFRNGDFTEATALLEQLANDSSIDKDTQAEVYTVLGRVYMAERRDDEAKDAMMALLKLEPPVIELDPVRETPQLMRTYYEARYELCGSYTVDPMCGRANPDGPTIQTIAIGDFTNAATHNHNTYDPLRQGIASMMVGQLNAGIDLKVVERERLSWILDEQNLMRDANIVDQRTAVRVGRLLGANHFIFGVFSTEKRLFSRRMRIVARIVDVETGELIGAEEVTGRPGQVYEMTERLVLKLANAINVTIASGEEDPVRRYTKSLDAMIAYESGEALLSRGSYRAAHEKFLEALTYDPQFSLAQVKIDSIEPMLIASADPGDN